MKKLKTLRPTATNAALTAGLAVSISAIPLLGAAAQQAVPTPAPDEELPTVTVEGEGEPANALETSTGIGRLPGTVQDTPQQINVISQETMQQQGVTTLEQALRNVPGVTVGVGEGGGGMNGDQFRIRGFQAKGDIFIDGLRDFGTYVRDSFATESVQVLLGSSAQAFGLGTTGGAINQTQKTAHLGDKYDFEASGGNGPFGRTVVDLNKQINDTTAVRIVGMYTEQDIVDRDHVYNDRYGILGSIGFGLGTDETLTLNYLYQSGERKPDMGVPIATPPAAYQSKWGSLGRPVTEQPSISRSNYYGKDTDLDDYDVNMFTARYKKEVNDWLTVTNDTRIAGYSRYFAQTVTNCSATNNADNGGSSCAANLFDDDPATVPVYGFGGPAGFDQDIWGMENITTAIARFNTGFLRHELIGGIDLFYQHDKRTQLANYRANGTSGSGVKTPGTIYDPNYDSQDPSFPNGGYVVELNDLAKKKATATDFAAFVSDRVWLTDQFSVLGGIRWDNYSAKYKATDTSSGEWTGCTAPGTGGNTGTTETCAVDAESRTSFNSPKVSLIWEPTANQTYYATWAVSYSDIAGQFISNDNASITNETLEPSRNETYEVGSKLSLFDGKLGVTAALYQVTKDNAKQEDTAGDLVPTGERQRVRGIDLGLTGNITDAWTVQFAYSYMDSEILASATDSAVIGNRVAFVPENSFSVWSVYDLTKHGLPTIPGTLLVGGGVTYQEQTFANSANTSIIPEYFTFDALVSYQYKNYRFALNGYNLTDELNYSGGFGNRAVVGPGRAFTLTVGATF